MLDHLFWLWEIVGLITTVLPAKSDNDSCWMCDNHNVQSLNMKEWKLLELLIT